MKVPMGSGKPGSVSVGTAKNVSDVEVMPGNELLATVTWLMVLVTVTVLPLSLLMLRLLFLLVWMPSANPPMNAPSTTRMTITMTIIPLRVLYQDRCRCGRRGCEGGPSSSFWRYPSDSLCICERRGASAPSCSLSCQCSESFKRNWLVL